jgi:HicA toxin of bacterial toxin-antitoxin,
LSDIKICYHFVVNSRQRKTLNTLFEMPTLKNIVWADIESLLCALGCELIEGNGSRVAFKYKNWRADFHRPHPGKEAKPYQVKAAASFLTDIGVTP